MRLPTILAATAVAAAVTIPAGADERTDGTFADCLRSHGLAIPADAGGVEIKEWALQHAADPATKRAFAACKPQGESPERLVACLREQGLEPPAAIDQLKPWLGRRLEGSDGKAALRACGIATAPKAAAPADREKLGCGEAEDPKDEEQ